MYVYLINNQKVTFETELEAADAIIEAETNGFSWELVSEGPGDPTVKTEEETKKDDAEASVPKIFQTDAAESVDVVSETTPTQDTDSNLEDGSSDLTEPNPVNYNNFLSQQANKALLEKIRIEELTSYSDKDLEARDRDIGGRETAKFQVEEEQFQAQLKQDDVSEKEYKEKNPAFNVKKTQVQIEAEQRKAMQTKEALKATEIADQLVIKTDDKIFSDFISKTDLTGKTITDLQYSGNLVAEMRNKIKEDLGIGFFGGGDGITTETIDLISRAAIQRAKDQDSLNQIKKQKAVLEENNIATPQIFENTLNNNVNYILQGLNPAEQDAVNAKKEVMLLEKNRPVLSSFGGVASNQSEFNKELFAYADKLKTAKENYAELNEKRANSDKFFNGGEDQVMTFDKYTNERLTFSQDQAEDQGITTVDLSEQYKNLASQIPGTYEGAKSAWYLNVNESLILKESLQNKPEDFKVTGYAKWDSLIRTELLPTLGMSLGGMVDARARGVDFSDVKVEGALEGGDNLNKYLDNIVARRKYLNLNQAVVNDLFLFNNDYSNPGLNETLGGKAAQFFKIMTTGLIGEKALDVSLNALGIQSFTTQEQLDQAVRTLPELGFELNENQQKNLDRTWGMEATEMTAGLGGAVMNFFVGNKIIKGLKIFKVANKLAKGGYEYISIGDKAKTLLSSSSTIAKAQGVLLTGLKEEALMQTAFLGEAPMGQGLGWGLGSLAGGKIGSMLPKFSGRFWGLGGIAQHAIGGATGGFAAHPVSMFTEAMYDSVANDKTFKTVMNESFIRDANGNDVHLLRDMFISTLGFTVFGFKDMKRSTVKNLFISTRKVRNIYETTGTELNQQAIEGVKFDNYKEKLSGEKLESYEKLVDDHLTARFNLKIIEGVKGNTVMSEMQSGAESAAAYLKMSPEQRAKSTLFSSRSEAEAVQLAFYQNLQSINTLVTAEFNNFKKGLKGIDKENGKNITLEIVDNILTPQWKNTRGNYNSKTGVLTINTSNLTSGVTKHEFNHILLSSLKGVEGAPVKLRSVIESDVDAAMKKYGKSFFLQIDGTLKEYTSFAEYIDAVHSEETSRMSEAERADYNANEYLSYLTQNLKGESAFRDALIDGGVLSTMKSGVTKFASLLGQSEKIGNFSFKNKDGVEDAPVSASEIVQFYDSFANGGLSVKSNKNAIKGYENLLGNLAITPSGKTLNKHTGTEAKSLEGAYKETMNSKVIDKTIIEFERTNSERLNDLYKNYVAEGKMDTESIAGMMGYHFGETVAKGKDKGNNIVRMILESHIGKHGLNSIAEDTKLDIMSELSLIELPKAIKAYMYGQEFVKEVVDNKLSKEDAYKLFKENPDLQESGGTARRDRLYAFAKNRMLRNEGKPVANSIKEGTLTTYIMGNLGNRLLNVLKLPEYRDMFQTESLDRLIEEKQGEFIEGESDNFSDGESPASYDTSSPLNSPRRSRLTAQAKLRLSTKTVEKLEKTVDEVFATDKLEDLDAKSIGTVELGKSGKVKMVFKNNNQAEVTYADGSKEIMLGARSPKPIIAKVITKVKAEAFRNARNPKLSEAERKEAQAQYEEYSKLLGNPPKLNKQKIFKDRLRATVSKAIFEEMSKDAGEVGTAEYAGFVKRAYALFKDNLSQRTINKRFPEFKEPLLDSNGKQIRDKTAAGAPLFVKRKIDLAEWQGKFLEGSEQNINRTSLIEALSEELGFDRTFEMIMSTEGKKQIESGQEKLGVPLMEAYVAVIGKNIDRGIANGGMDSKYLKEAAEYLGKELSEVQELYEKGMEYARDKVLWVDYKEAGVIDVMETVVALDFNAKQSNDPINTTAGIQSLKRTPSIGLGDPIKIKDENGDFASNGKGILAYTKKEFMELAPTFNEFSTILGPIFQTLTTTKASNTSKILAELSGISAGKGFKGEVVLDANGNYVSTNPGGSANRKLFNEIVSADYKESPIELSDNSKETIANFESLLKQNIAYKASLNISKENAKGEILNSIIGNQNRLKSVQAKITEKGESPEKQIKELNEFRNSVEGKAAVLDIALGDALLETVLAVSGDMYNQAIAKGSSAKAVKVANMLEIMLLNNTGTGLRSLSSMNLLHFGNEKLSNSRKNKFKKKKQKPNSPKDLGANEHILAKQKFGLKIMGLLRNGELNDLAKIREVTYDFESLIGSEDKQVAGDVFGSRTGLLNRYAKAIIAVVSERIREPLGRIKSDLGFVKYAYGKIGGKKGARSENQLRVDAVMAGTISKEGIAHLKYTYDYVRGQTMYETFIQNELQNSKNNFSVSKEVVAKNGKTLNKIIASGVDVTSDFPELVKLMKNPIGPVSQLVVLDKISESYNSKVNKKRLEIEDKKTGETRFETAKEYEKRLKELEKTSPELYLPKGIAEMIERKGGAKTDEEVSDSKAYNEGKKRYNDLFIPANSEDFQGMLYKLYGKGKQGNEDMAWMKKNILRPYTAAENALSTYRMNLVVDYKALETQMKAMGDGKAEVASVKRVEKLGFNIDQAVRVYMWSRLGREIPGISDVEIAQLTGAVHNSPRLRAYAKGIMQITKTAEKYPDPTANWFRSNVQYDLFTYATDGVRSDFLAPWQANVDAAFSKENLNKLEARFGTKYVKNLEEILTRMSTGRSRIESTNEAFNKALDYVNGSVATIMFLNMRSAGLQTISAANYVNWTDNNPVAIGKVIAENPKLFFKTAQKIWSSDALKDRRTGLRINVEEAEMAKAINAGGRTNLQGLWDTMVRVGFKPTQMADSFAIVTGGTPFYMNRMKTYEKDGLSKSEAENKAFEDFLDLTQETQQSSQMDRVSNIQTGLMGRLIFSFNNTPFQMARIQKKTALDLVNGRGDAKSNVSKLAYYAFVQSTLFYGLQQGFYSSFMSEDDDKLTEKQKIAKYKDFDKRLDRIGTSTFQGILTGSGLPGKIAVTGWNTFFEARKQYSKGYAGKDFFPVLNKALSISPTLGSKVSRMGRNWNSLIFSDFTKRGREVKNLYGPFDPQNPNNKAYLSMFGTATNIPLDRIIQKMENIQGVLNENNENWERVAMFFGAPKWSLQSAEENKSDMDDRLDKFYKETVPKKERDSISARNLTKIEQQNLINDLGITNREIKYVNDEDRRVNFILKRAKETNVDLEKLIPKYETVKEVKTDQYKKLEKLTKNKQQEMLNDLGITNREIKNTTTEDARVKLIIKKLTDKYTPKQNTNKQNSLK